MKNYNINDFKVKNLDLLFKTNRAIEKNAIQKIKYVCFHQNNNRIPKRDFDIFIYDIKNNKIFSYENNIEYCNSNNAIHIFEYSNLLDLNYTTTRTKSFSSAKMDEIYLYNSIKDIQYNVYKETSRDLEIHTNELFFQMDFDLKEIFLIRKDCRRIYIDKKYYKVELQKDIYGNKTNIKQRIDIREIKNILNEFDIFPKEVENKILLDIYSEDYNKCFMHYFNENRINEYLNMVYVLYKTERLKYTEEWMQYPNIYTMLKNMDKEDYVVKEKHEITNYKVEEKLLKTKTISKKYLDILDYFHIYTNNALEIVNIIDVFEETGNIEILHKHPNFFNVFCFKLAKDKKLDIIIKQYCNVFEQLEIAENIFMSFDDLENFENNKNIKLELTESIKKIFIDKYKKNIPEEIFNMALYYYINGDILNALKIINESNSFYYNINVEKEALTNKEKTNNEKLNKYLLKTLYKSISDNGRSILNKIVLTKTFRELNIFKQNAILSFFSNYTEYTEIKLTSELFNNFLDNILSIILLLEENNSNIDLYQIINNILKITFLGFKKTNITKSLDFPYFAYKYNKPSDLHNFTLNLLPISKLIKETLYSLKHINESFNRAIKFEEIVNINNLSILELERISNISLNIIQNIEIEKVIYNMFIDINKNNNSFNKYTPKNTTELIKIILISNIDLKLLFTCFSDDYFLYQNNKEKVVLNLNKINDKFEFIFSSPFGINIKH